jgi:hypothetical protein
VRKPPVSALKVWLDRLQTLYATMVRVRLPRIFGLVLRNPRDSACAVALMLSVTAIVANGLYLQPGRHPAPIFAIRPLPVRSDEPAATAGTAPQPPPRRSEPARSEPAPRREAAVTAKIGPVPLPPPRPRAHSAFVGMRTDAATDAPVPSLQVALVQRTLNIAGYGPIKVNGILDDSTREGIARFEQDHNLPVTGQNTLRVRHALSAATGRVLD